MNTLDEILQLSQKFIAIPSIPEKPKQLEKILHLAARNIPDFTIEEFCKDGISSVLIYNRSSRPKKFKIILNGHLDVIPGKESQYTPKIIGNKLYGVGSMDMKSNVACLMQAFKATAKKIDYPLALQLVTDEQTGSLCGTKHQIDMGVRASFVIIGETTNFQIVNQAKGVMWIKISTQGKTSHSAYPWQGENAIWKMNEFLHQLQKAYPIPATESWKSTISVSRIETQNNSFNKIPDNCTVWLDVRYIPGEKTSILNKLKKLTSVGFDLKIFFEESQLFVDENNRYLHSLQKMAAKELKREVSLHRGHGTSDATYYAKVGCPAVEFGPIGQTGNTHDEYVDIPSLEIYYKILTEFLLSGGES